MDAIKFSNAPNAVETSDAAGSLHGSSTCADRLTARKTLQVIAALLAAAAGLLAGPAAGQYKWHTAEGTTVYSDLPPPPGARLMKEPQVKMDGTAAGTPDLAPAAELPYDLRVVNSKFPVLLYTAPDCAPCAAARQHLAGRGIPFTEKSISTSADFEAFKSRGFSENSFPALTVGREKAVGFEPGAYDRLLNAADYPRTSRLPPNYRQPAAEPLTPPQPQKLDVTVQREAGAGSPTGSAEALSAIEIYRRQVQAGTPNPTADTNSSMRF